MLPFLSLNDVVILDVKQVKYTNTPDTDTAGNMAEEENNFWNCPYQPFFLLFRAPFLSFCLQLLSLQTLCL